MRDKYAIPLDTGDIRLVIPRDVEKVVGRLERLYPVTSVVPICSTIYRVTPRSGVDVAQLATYLDSFVRARCE